MKIGNNLYLFKRSGITVVVMAPSMEQAEIKAKELHPKGKDESTGPFFIIDKETIVTSMEILRAKKTSTGFLNSLIHLFLFWRNR